MASIASLRAFDCRSYWVQYGVSVNARTCALAVPTNLRRVIIAAGETLTRIFAHKITLANLDPGLTQNIVGRCDVETKLWHCVVQEKDPSGEVEGPRCLFEFDLSILTARELFRCNPLDKIDRLGNSPSQVGEARILGTEVRRFNADQLSHCSARKVKSDTNLAGQVEHIGTNAHLEKHGFLNLVSLAMRCSFIKDAGKCAQILDVDGNRNLVHRKRHVFHPFQMLRLLWRDYQPSVYGPIMCDS